MKVRIGLGVAFVSVLVGCSASSSSDELTPAQQTAIKALSPLGDVPPDPTNQYADDADVATFGQKLFFEKRFSGPIFKLPDDGMNALGALNDANKVACVSCHDVNDWFRDTRSQPPQTSLGVGYDIRNSPTLINAQYYKWTENDGVVDMEWADGLFAIELPWVMGATRLHVAHTIYDHYKDAYNALKFEPKLDDSLADMTRFPPEAIPKFPADAPDSAWEKMTAADQELATRVFVNFGKATGAYIRKLVSKNAPFDKYVAGDKTAITAAAERGLHLFVGKANCVACHKSPEFDDGEFHNTGYEPVAKQAHIDYITGIPGPEGSPPIVPPHVENGRFDAIGLLLGTEFNSSGKWSDNTTTGKLQMSESPDGGGAMVPLAALESDKGKWRTKSLRSIAKTAPYFHNGQFATLLDVVKFYNDGGGQDVSDGTTRGYLGTKDDTMKKLNLTDPEMGDIVEFLGTLTGDEVPAELRMDTSAP